MSGNKKFGTFAGVFTPSILTILGVIMYMRLGWVVGNAGLWGAIIIILIAHVISITTGLSISSIATDKKVGAGGVYYVLSRSLGLPIGGAIGLTLFVGTALSIALYLVGFAESFNAYLGFDNSINTIRITGSLALFVLTAIALISTSVALKTQFFIMGAIALSLISIFFGDSEFKPEHIPFFGSENSVSLEEVFAIFFPAVTGFTAGIAMSGDLKDPKKSIPVGTISAIIVGLLIYISLAIFIAYNIDENTLKTDYNVLMKIALFAPFVVAGIWGATLSSALGGILGGPRILQAMSIDSITPKIFAKGKGKDNEPWNALILTVIIAEGGILLGELDLIARVVSMFYLAAYGFINISFYLESWASTDFTPSFKIKNWIGLIGAIATFAVMFKLDMLAMFAAFIIIGGVYLYLTRKEIALGTGDVWQSVWNSIVRTGLKKMEHAKEDHKRNWKPNVLLFSGNTEQRPYLIEFTKALSGKGGMVTNFDLIEVPDAHTLFPKPKEIIKDEVLSKYNIFGRKIQVKNIYEGIESLASTFGFSGIEPNTVVMGWAKNTKDPIWFANMTKHLINLDYNVLYLDYDKRFGFGNKQTIDIWWRNLNDNTDLALNITRFLLLNEEWRNAKVRVFYVNNTLQEGFERKIHNKLDEYRIIATVKVFNNTIEQKPFYDILKATSKGTDLIIAGIPEIEQGKEKDFVDETTKLFEEVGTTLLIKSSSKLSEEKLLTENDNSLSTYKTNAFKEIKVSLPYIEDVQIRNIINEIKLLFDEKITHYCNERLSSLENTFNNLLFKVHTILINAIKSFEENNDADLKNIRKIQEQNLKQLFEIFEDFEEDINYLAEQITLFTNEYIDDAKTIPNNLPKTVKRQLIEDDLIPKPGDSLNIRYIKFWKRLGYKLGIKPKVNLPVEKFVKFHLNQEAIKEFDKFQNKLGVATYKIQNEIKRYVIESVLLLDNFYSNKDKKDNIKELINKKTKAIQKYNVSLNEYITSYLSSLYTFILKLLIKDFERIDIDDLIELYDNKKPLLKKYQPKLLSFPYSWSENQRCFINNTKIDILLHRLTYAVKLQEEKLKLEIQSNIFNKVESEIKNTVANLNEIKNKIASGKSEEINEDWFEINTDFGYDELVLSGIFSYLDSLSNDLPSNISTFNEEAKNNLINNQHLIQPFNVDVAEICAYIIESELHLPLEKYLNVIPQQCIEELSKIQHALKLISFSLNNISETKNKELLELIQRTENIINESTINIEKKKDQALGKIDDIFLTTITNLNIAHIVEQTEQIKSHYLKQEKKNRIQLVIDKLKDTIQKRIYSLNLLISKKRDEILYAEFQHQNKKHENAIQRVRKFVKNITPELKTLNNIPFYYQQLFIGKHTPKLQFLYNRERELEEFKNALNSRSKIVGSGILIIGEPLTGKSFFAEIAVKETTNNKIYKIEPPVNGAIKVKDFNRAIQSAIGSKNITDDNILEAPENSVFIINDLELWWERSAEGYEVVKKIIKLIEKYGNKYLFVVVCNIHAFNVIKQQYNFHSYFIATIHLAPFGSLQLKQAILNRHNMSGFELYSYKTKEPVKERHLNKYINKIQTITKGNVGSAYHLWLTSIKDFNDGKIYLDGIKEEKLPSISKSDWLILLMNFVLHKHLSVQRIKRIFGYSTKSEAYLMLQNLIRSGLIEETISNTYKINDYVLVYVVDYLKEKGIL
ncbi:MAG: hypothetical protein Kow0079_12480 [Vicingaceae bacterium]